MFFVKPAARVERQHCISSCSVTWVVIYKILTNTILLAKTLHSTFSMRRYHTRSTGMNSTGTTNEVVSKHPSSNPAQTDSRPDRKRRFLSDQVNTAGNAAKESESKKEEKLPIDNTKGLLIENSKLKDILRGKDQAIRKQFNLIVTWVKEMLDICKKYNNKISETSKMLSELKLSNNVLQQIIATYQTQKSSLENEESECQLIDFQPGTSKDEMEIDDSRPTQRELLLIAQVRELQQKSNDNSDAHLKYQEAENRRIDCQQLTEKFETNRKELILMQKIDDSYLSDLIEYDDCIVGLKMKYLKEVLAMLEKSFQKSEEKGKCDIPNKKRRYENGLETLNEKLQKLITCFAKQCIQSFDIINLTEECDNVVKIFTEARIDSCSILRRDEKNNNKPIDYCNLLIDQQLQMIKDERVVRNVQEQLFKVLSDYDRVVDLLESLRNDNPKSDFKKKNEFIDTETVILSKEYRRLSEENSQLLQTVSALRTEKNALQRDYKLLGAKYRELMPELQNVKEKLINSESIIIDLRDQNSQLLNNRDNEILAYGMQAEIREIEYIELEASERNHVQQIKDLTSELQRLRQENNAEK